MKYSSVQYILNRSITRWFKPYKPIVFIPVEYSRVEWWCYESPVTCVRASGSPVVVQASSASNHKLLYTAHCKLHTVHFTLHTAHCTLYTTAHCTWHTPG